MTSHIPTLLLREWMQHKRGWLIAALTPPLLFLALLPFGHVEGGPEGPAELLALAALVVSGAAVYVVCLLFTLFQLPGLARRDTQDRSIEFWLSLPGRPSESVGATVLAHAWLAPLGGAAAGTLLGLPIALSVLGRTQGWSEAFAAHWGEVIAAALPLLLRGFAGTALLTLWLLPMIFVLMAASAWLKRLGVPLVMVGGGVALTVLYKVYGIEAPLHALMAWNQHINHTLLVNGHAIKDALMGSGGAGDLWVAMAQDLGRAVAELASVDFVGCLAVAAAGFAAVVAKRSRGG